MDFLAGVHDVICTRKIILTEAPRSISPRSVLFFLVHITSCTQAEKTIHVIIILYNQTVL